MSKRRFLYIVDDEAIVRASIVSLVQAHGDYECREFANGDTFLAALDGLEPGCVVLDLQLEGAGGDAAMAALSQRTDRFRTVVVTGFSDLDTAIAALRAGALDFLHKPYEMRPLLDAIERGFHLIEHGSEPAALVEAVRSRLQRLQPDEAAVLKLLIQGQTNEQIGRALDIDARSVQLLRARILTTLDAPTILAAIRLAGLAGCLATLD